MTTPRRRRRTAPLSHDNPTDYRYPDKRKNNPPAQLAGQGRIADAPKQRYAYDPHLPPVLRFDPDGAADKLPELLRDALTRPLNGEEVQQLADALRNHQPWLEWAGKREKRGFEVDSVALYIHERVSAQAILKMARRQDVQRTLWGDPELEYHEALQFYQHEMDWANRLILGDSLVVMNSLAKREDLAGKVQMIYMDPPYGIRFSSNFQPTVRNRNVTDHEVDLTREPEMVKAYRDTWTLGVHSYLTYLRDRLTVARELLTDTGNIFVQIGDENLNLVRGVLDEVFGRENFVVTICFKKKAYQEAGTLAAVNDYVLWYAKSKELLKYNHLFTENVFDGDVGKYTKIESPDCIRRSSLDFDEEQIENLVERGWRLVRDDYPIVSQDPASAPQPFEFEGKVYEPSPGRHWSQSYPTGMNRLAMAGRIRGTGRRLYAVVFWNDDPKVPLSNFWDQMKGAANPIYVVQTTELAVERCLLMATDPGDLVLDPTCGSGTTAYVAEQWGRRWITIDTSRVALALARQRILTARFDHFRTSDGSNKLHARSFVYKTVPHVTLKSIGQNTALDPIFAKWEPVLAEKLVALNRGLNDVTPQLRASLLAKLEAKRRRRDRSDPVTDADERRWNLPKDEWEKWQVPLDSDPDWPPTLQAALTEYRVAWRQKMDEVNACIAAAADPEELVDQPEVERGVVRVSGPFTAEAVQPAEESLEDDTSSDNDDPSAGSGQALETFGGDAGIDMSGTANEEAYLDRMIRLLRQDGVRFPENKVNSFERLEPLREGSVLHAEGEWANGNGEQRRVAAAFGPQYGPVTAKQVDECLRAAHRRGYDDLVIAGFSFDGAAQAAIQADPNPEVRCHMAHISPDVNMAGLLKETRDSQLFTVFGLPRTEVRKADSGEYTIEMQGVDIYDPVSNSLQSASAHQVAAWFLDSDYDGQTFCITQAFFPDASAWDKLARALKGSIPEEAFATFSGTVSLLFPEGKHSRIAVKVIDPRGNEVMSVHHLGEAHYG